MDEIKKRHKVTAKSLANLKPVQKGEKGRNPLGWHAHDPHKRELKKITNETVKEVIELGLVGKISELEDIRDDDDAPALKRGLARAIINATNEGNFHLLQAMFERLIGKVPDQINHNVNQNISVKVHLPANGREAIVDKSEPILLPPISTEVKDDSRD